MEATGVVLSFNETRGFGFIREDGSGEEVFFLSGAVTETISAGDRVVFISRETERGYMALRIRKLGGSMPQHK